MRKFSWNDAPGSWRRSSGEGLCGRLCCGVPIWGCVRGDRDAEDLTHSVGGRRGPRRRGDPHGREHCPEHDPDHAELRPGSGRLRDRILDEIGRPVADPAPQRTRTAVERGQRRCRWERRGGDDAGWQHGRGGHGPVARDPPAGADAGPDHRTRTSRCLHHVPGHGDHGRAGAADAAAGSHHPGSGDSVSHRRADERGTRPVTFCHEHDLRQLGAVPDRDSRRHQHAVRPHVAGASGCCAGARLVAVVVAVPQLPAPPDSGCRLRRHTGTRLPQGDHHSECGRADDRAGTGRTHTGRDGSQDTPRAPESDCGHILDRTRPRPAGNSCRSERQCVGCGRGCDDTLQRELERKCQGQGQCTRELERHRSPGTDAHPAGALGRLAPPRQPVGKLTAKTALEAPFPSACPPCRPRRQRMVERGQGSGELCSLLRRGRRECAAAFPCREPPRGAGSLSERLGQPARQAEGGRARPRGPVDVLVSGTVTAAVTRTATATMASMTRVTRRRSEAGRLARRLLGGVADTVVLHDNDQTRLCAESQASGGHSHCDGRPLPGPNPA